MESLPLYLAHVCACVTGLQHSALYRFGRFAQVQGNVETVALRFRVGSVSVETAVQTNAGWS